MGSKRQHTAVSADCTSNGCPLPPRQACRVSLPGRRLGGRGTRGFRRLLPILCPVRVFTCNSWRCLFSLPPSNPLCAPLPAPLLPPSLALWQFALVLPTIEHGRKCRFARPSCRRRASLEPSRQQHLAMCRSQGRSKTATCNISPVFRLRQLRSCTDTWTCRCR